jgi:hypothetical protein
MAVRGNTWEMSSTDMRFSAPELWYPGLFSGDKAVLIGDVDGDGRADLVAVGDSSDTSLTTVMLSAEQPPWRTAPGFLTPVYWSRDPFFGTRATLLGDVTGDGRADLVAVNGNDTWVMISTGSEFSAPAQWSGERFFGTKATLLGDVTGDGRADLVAVNGNDTWVMVSSGTGFFAPREWSGQSFFGNKATLLGDITGDGRADLVAVNVFSVDDPPPSEGDGLGADSLGDGTTDDFLQTQRRGGESPGSPGTRR